MSDAGLEGLAAKAEAEFDPSRWTPRRGSNRRQPRPGRDRGAQGVEAVKTNLLLEYDESVDAAYLTVADKPWDHQVRLDDSRGLDYAADGSVIGIEILSPRRKGVRLEGLPFRDDVARVMQSVAFRILEAAR
jgi:uncharacterized protein YuzE